MNTPAIAQNLAARGRGEDKMLVHMTPSEVQGLQALAMAKGGSLTINPETGLPEAGFLSDTFKALAPTIIGAGLTYFSGGAINPYMAAGIVGGVEGLRKNDLGAGLMAGLGAFGGANLVGSLGAMGAAGAGATGAGGAGSMTSVGPGGATLGGAGGIGLGGQGINQAALGGTYNAATATSGANAFGLGSPAMARQTTGSLVGSSAGPVTTGGGALIEPGATTLAGQPITPVTQITAETTPLAYGGPEIVDQSYAVGELDKIAAAREGYAPSFRQNVGTGVDRLFEEGGFSEFAKNYPGGKLGLAALAAGPAIGVLDAAGAFEQEGYEMPGAGEEDYNYEGPYLPAERTARFRGRDAILGGSGEEFRYFDRVNPYPNVRTAADGGYMMAGGRYLQGDGDGTSDSIPAMIGNDQPARLADGEFVLDARTVSEIGNGSSDAGARKLYALMDNVHKARQNADRGKPSGADQLLKGLTATA